MTKDKEILELAEAFGVGCQMQCQECPVIARFKTERPEDDELYGPSPCFIIEDGKCFDCVDYIRATAVYDAGYRKQSKWISVEEKLPDTQHEVLTYSECNGVRSACLIAVKDDFKTWYLCASGKISISVTHWMPLPEAPKGGAE